jgi:hypothetical protein
MVRLFSATTPNKPYHSLGRASHPSTYAVPAAAKRAASSSASNGIIPALGEFDSRGYAKLTNFDSIG